MCDDGFECRESEGGGGYLCCQIPGQKNTLAGLVKARTFLKRPTPRTVPTTIPPVPITSEPQPRCGQDILPLMMDGEFLRCPQLEAPCPKAGYTCQIADGGLYCCPLDVEIDYIEETTTLPSVPLRKVRPEKPCKGGSKN
ncbi:hypothetical protein ANCCAN_11339 [Ancylostoma caninum]|uniref:Uncharacterized protein n=1 Tax=Ancylostoma caninum TaxID=29170 RepID=A0A368GHH2_ANCCA|nr:hypothetical protein ANCCAN_11339 [Ancylostoma caninum]